MSKNRFTFALGLALVASATLTGRASASFNYATSLTSGSSSAGVVTILGGNLTLVEGGTTVTLAGVARNDFAVPTPVDDTIKLIAITVTTTDTTPISFTLNYGALIALSNVGPPGFDQTRDLPFSGTLTFTDVSTTTGSITNVFNVPNAGSVIVGGVKFTGAVDQYAAPTINGASGAISGDVTASAVPEPASIAMLGLGMGGVALAVLRRRRQA